MSADYSLIMITANRPELFRRSLDYLSNQHFSGPILIADASGAGPREAIQAAVAAHRDRLWLELFGFPEHTSPTERLLFLARQVKTELVIWQGDDDFICPGWLSRAVRLMMERPEVAAVVGQAWTFSVAGNGTCGKVTSCQPYRQFARPEATARDRLLAHAGAFATTCYGLRRTRHFQRSMEMTVAPFVGHYPFTFFEILDGGHTVIRGPVVRLEQPSLFRQIHDASTGARQASAPFHEVITSAEWHENITRVVDGWAVALVEEDGIDEPSAVAAARWAAAIYWSDALARKLVSGADKRRPIAWALAVATELLKRVAGKSPSLRGRTFPEWATIRAYVERSDEP